MLLLTGIEPGISILMFDDLLELFVLFLLLLKSVLVTGFVCGLACITDCRVSKALDINLEKWCNTFPATNMFVLFKTYPVEKCFGWL